MMKSLTSALLVTLVGTFSACGLLYQDDEQAYSNYKGNYSGSAAPAAPACVSNPPANEKVMDKGTCDDQRAALLSLSDDELYAKATSQGVGNCEIHDGSDATVCNQYVKVTTATWWNRGWPLNPDSKDSTGCVSTHCYPGYSPDMCGCDLTKNAVAQILDALKNSHDVCGICDPRLVITTDMILGES